MVSSIRPSWSDNVKSFSKIIGARARPVVVDMNILRTPHKSYQYILHYIACLENRFALTCVFGKNDEVKVLFSSKMDEIIHVPIERGFKGGMPQNWDFDIEMEVGPERLPYQVVKTIKERSPIMKDQKLFRHDIIIGVENVLTIAKRTLAVKQLIRKSGPKVNLTILRPNLYQIGSNNALELRRMALECLRRVSPIVIVLQVVKKHNCEWATYGFSTLKAACKDKERFFRCEVVRHVWQLDVIGWMDQAEEVEVVRKGFWEIEKSHGAVDGDLLPAEKVPPEKVKLWNTIYMGDILLKLADDPIFDNDKFVNLRMELKQKVCLTVLPMSPLRSFLRG